jgi:hypothetical protein
MEFSMEHLVMWMKMRNMYDEHKSMLDEHDNMNTIDPSTWNEIKPHDGVELDHIVED